MRVNGLLYLMFMKFKDYLKRKGLWRLNDHFKIESLWRMKDTENKSLCRWKNYVKRRSLWKLRITLKEKVYVD